MIELHNNLTDEQRSFFKENDIPLDKVLDAKGLTLKEMREQLKAQGKWVAYNSQPCIHNHKLNIRSKTACLECNHHNICFIKRHHAKGQVYIARSEHGNITKVGCTNDFYERESSLNANHYADCTDWKIVYTIELDADAGKIEDDTHKILSNYAIPIFFDRYSYPGIAKESFTCDAKTAKKAVLTALKDNHLAGTVLYDSIDGPGITEEMDSKQKALLDKIFSNVAIS